MSITPGANPGITIKALSGAASIICARGIKAFAGQWEYFWKLNN